MTNRNFEIGQSAEAQARAFLETQKLIFVDNNYTATHSRTGKKLGEIDLIMRDPPHLVFVEVKCRKQSDHGDVLEMVTPHKQSCIIIAAKYYLLENRLWDKVQSRFDVVGISPTAKEPIAWIKNAFEVQY